MNEETRLLRDALEQCLKVMPELDGHAEETWLPGLASDSEDAQKQAHFALRVTSGRLPLGYQVVKWPLSFYVTREGEYLLIEGRHASFESDFAARVFCWQHAEEQGEKA